ncbi:unnamed protein product [Fusarium graminearum]|uniref:Chromosome 3, complete genome n=2 Tax=Gibberella zeae TaxID=5518 RepID=I1SAS2_GIBZE|nr:hypothetical protein FGSG_13953 [Fusarium graminearum PH-1]EYB23483.1 hypothetical protein FG05_13953 [Fusarium graminearum]ESU18152.1 hypothetical protein FGSG_13953 [Fusarium graminearum PH-1]CAF3466943.1 unnamed protein product [Fusarium graminearum]CAF3598737.1 unnamed protein product [Fusarium graminearum]CAG1979911.1 unnamed protein product [Fusarium graminearum]|eukprot:XP_011325774.1 hypothetical protein FGSG_13953 [Fusarium graminearum PH-1]
MTLDFQVESWIQKIDPSSNRTARMEEAAKQEPFLKRRRLNTLRSDASRSEKSMDYERSLRSSKRAPSDDYETPRPARRTRTPRSESGTSLPFTQSGASQQSELSSPTKQLRALQLHSKGVVAKQLSAFHDKPAALEVLLDKIDLVSSGIGILPASHVALFSHLDRDTYSDFKWTQHPVLSKFLFSNDRDEIGHTPSPETVQWILHEAAFCDNKGCSKTDWNTEVHHRVLTAALRPQQGPRRDQLLDFRLSKNASIINEYHVTSASTTVDFCMYIDPKQDKRTKTVETIETIREILPMGMFNHANFSPLSDNPIAVSIETKGTGEGWENAKLQMEVWMSAHWQFLRQLLEMRQDASTKLSVLRSRAGEMSFCSDKIWDLPEFIPGIIIQGHDWHLVITTAEGEKTMFWQKKTLGDTSSSKGIYQIIYNLQLLRQWAQEEYWKWFKDLLLEWPRSNGELVF